MKFWFVDKEPGYLKVYNFLYKLFSTSKSKWINKTNGKYTQWNYIYVDNDDLVALLPSQEDLVIPGKMSQR